MAEEDNMGRMLFCFIFIVYANSVSSRFCLNPKCSEPIASARVKMLFQNKDVHLYPGDEVDILSKSDDGSHLEFEIGGVKGIIPIENLKESSLKMDSDSLIHVPEFDHGEDDETDPSDEMAEEEPDDYEGLHPELEEMPDDYIPQETKILKKPKKKTKNLGKKLKVKDASPKKDASTEIDGDGKKMDKTLGNNEGKVPNETTRVAEDKQQTDSKEDANVAQQLGEALAPGSKANDETLENGKTLGSVANSEAGNVEHVVGGLTTNPVIGSHSSAHLHAEILKLENYKIMKKRYVQDYLDTNHAGQNIDENMRRQVEEFIEGDMLEQIKEPESDLLQMLLHYNPKDLPGGSGGEEEAKKENASEGQEETKLKSEQKKDDDKKEGKVEEVNQPVDDASEALKLANDIKDEGKVNEGQKENVLSSIIKTVDAESNSDASTQKEAKMLTEEAVKSEEKQPNAVESSVEESSAKKESSEEQKQDFMQHPNFPALKKRYVENYLKTHYNNEEVSPHIILMVENLVSNDLVQQLNNADRDTTEELMRLAPEVRDEDAVKVEKVKTEEAKDETQTTRSESELMDSPVNEPTNVPLQTDNIVDNVIRSSVVTSAAPEDLSTTKHESENSSKDAEQRGHIIDAPRSTTEAGSEPIPPAGGKDNHKHMEVEASEKSDVIAEESLSIKEKDDPRGSEEEKSITEEQNASKEGRSNSATEGIEEMKEEDLDVDKDTLKDTDKGESTREESSMFSLRKLGNVLKDRFKAFASKVAANQEDASDKQEHAKDSGDETSTDQEQSKEQEDQDSTKKEENESKSSEDKDVKSKIENLDSNPESNPPSTEEPKENSEMGGDVSLADLLREESLKAEEKSAEEIQKQEAPSTLSNDAEKESVKDDSQPGKTEHAESEMKDHDVLKNVASEEASQQIDREIDLVSQNPSMSTSGSEEQSTKTSVDGENVSTDASKVHKNAEEEEVESQEPDDASDNHEPASTEKNMNTDNHPEDLSAEKLSENVSEKPLIEATEIRQRTDEISSGDPERQSSSDPATGTPFENETTRPPHSEEPARKVEETVNQDNGEEQVDSRHHSEEKSNEVNNGEHLDPKQESNTGTGSSDADASVNVVPEMEASETWLNDPYVQQHTIAEGGRDWRESKRRKEEAEQLSRDILLEMCHKQPSLPECERLQTTKIYRRKIHSDDKMEKSDPDEDVGRLGRAWRNLMKIMKRIKLMKLGFVKLFHGPLSVMGLEDISHWIHDSVEHASPEVITITVCCLLLVFALIMKSCFTTKHVKAGASAYDVHKMRQSRQRILQENTEDMASEIRRLEEIILSKESELSSGGKISQELEKKLESLQAKFDEQENPSNTARLESLLSLLKNPRTTCKHQQTQSSQSSAATRQRHTRSLLETIRKELDSGKSQQKKLHEMIEEKEQEIQEADNMALRHQNEIDRQKEISGSLNDRLEKVVDELDLKDGIVLELQEKNGALRIELENLEMERRQLEEESEKVAERCKELEEQLKVKEEENGKLQDDIDEKENEVEVLRECMAQINNGKLDGEAVEDFETPEEDPDIKEQLKTERLKQIVESTQTLANLKKSEKEKEFFQEGYLEELEKREKAEEEVKTLKTEVEKLSKDVNTYKTSSTEYHIKLETLQQYFKQQESELHRKLSVEEQSRLEFQRKYESVIGQSNSAVEETTTVKSQNEDLKNEIKEMERSVKDIKIAAEKDNHELWIKNRQINRDLEEMKRERDIYRKRLLEAETAKKRAASPQVANAEKSRDSPAGSDDGRPASPGSQKSGASGVPNFMMRPMFPPPPPPPMFPPMRMPMGPMPPQPGPYGPMPPMMGRPQIPMSGPPSAAGGPLMSLSGQPTGPGTGPQARPITGPPGGPPSGMQLRPQNIPSSQFNAMTQPDQYVTPATTGFQTNPAISQHYMEAPSSNPNMSGGQNNQFLGQQTMNAVSQSPNQRPPLARKDSQKSLSSSSGRMPQGQTTPNMQRRFQPQPSSTAQGPFQSTPINSPNMPQTSHLPPSHPSLMGAQGQFGRPQLQQRTTGSDLA